MKRGIFILVFLIGIVSLSVFVSAIYDVNDNVVSDDVNGFSDGLENKFSAVQMNYNNVQGIVNTQRVIRDSEGKVISTNIVGEDGLINNFDRVNTVNKIDGNIVGDYYGYIVEFSEKPVKVKETEGMKF